MYLANDWEINRALRTYGIGGNIGIACSVTLGNLGGQTLVKQVAHQRVLALYNHR